MARVTHTIASLELSQAAYDEIEAKLLAAGYEHLFAAGPGSAIDLQSIVVTREPAKTMSAALDDFVKRNKAQAMTDSVIHRAIISQAIIGQEYCFMCDEMVSRACDRENCLRAANDRVRADLGLVP